MVTQDVVTLSVAQVIDLALNSPEIGAVNFNLLHNVLRIIAKQLEIHTTNVEFRGKDGERIKMLLATAVGKPSSAVLLTEYTITSDDQGNKTRTEVAKSPESTKSPQADKQEVVVLVQPDDSQTPQMTVCLSQQTIIDIQNDIDELKQHVSQLVDLPKNCNLLDALKNKDKPVVEMFQIMSLAKRLEAAENGLQKFGTIVEDLIGEMQLNQLQTMDANDYYEEEGVDSDNEQIKESPQIEKGSPRPSTSKGKPTQNAETPIVKAESAEEQQTIRKQDEQEKGGKNKKTSKAGQNVTKPQPQLKIKGGEPASSADQQSTPRSMAAAVAPQGAKLPIKRPLPDFITKITNCEKRLEIIEDTMKANGIPAPIVSGVKYTSKIDQQTLELHKSVPMAATSSPTYDTVSFGQPEQPLRGGKKEAKKHEDTSRLPVNDVVAALQKDITKIKREIRKLKSSGGGKDTDDSGPSKFDRRKGKKYQDSQLGDMETKVRDSAETLVSMDENFNNQILQMQNNFSILEMEVNNIMEKLTSALPGGDTGVETIGDLFKKMQGMQIDIENIAETTTNLIEDLARRRTNFDSLNETVELLKTIKADKEDIEDALADKADKCAINRKVSHDQFDTACDELSRGIEEALEKLTTQELLWQQALDEIQFEISNKLDKMELGPLRDFINNKLRMLQERMKSLTALKKEQEAAGTKSKFLRNVNCISCDKDVVMRKQMDAALMPQPRSLPPSRSMAPYLAYELDALRKQQKTSANSRNLNHFESAITGGKSPRMDDHVCNRYCGGSHTVTTPQQRVTRMGHFLAQWGPGAVPVTDTVPTKEEPKQERKSTLAEQGDQNKVPQTDAKSDGTAAVVAPQEERKSTRGSIKPGLIAPKVSPEDSKGRTPSIASGPGGDEKRSSGSQEKARTSIRSARGSQGSAKKRGSKGSAIESLKGSKQGVSHEGSKEAVIDENTKDVPEEIPEETPSEVAAAESPAQEPSEMGNPQNEDKPESVENAEKPPEVGEQANPQTEPEPEKEE